MSGSVNKCIILGNVFRDVEVRHSQAGQPIVNLSVATNESWTVKGSGEKKTRTEYHRVVIFNERLGEVAQKYLRKGSRVYIEGQIQTRRWTDKDGGERYTTEIVLGQYRGELVLLGGSSNGKTSDFDSDNEGSTPSPPSTGGGDLDDDIPF